MSWKSVCSPQQIYFFKSRRILLSLSCGSTTKLTIHRFHIDHNKPCFIPAPHPSPLKRQMHNRCFQFLLGIAAKFRGRREGGGWLVDKEIRQAGKGCYHPGGTPHIKGVGMLVGNFELNP